MFKYQIKIINNPIIHVTENLKKNEININVFDNSIIKEKNENENKIEEVKNEEDIGEKENQIKDKNKEENNINENKIIEKDNLDSEEEGVNNNKKNDIELTLNDEDIYIILYPYYIVMILRC